MSDWSFLVWEAGAFLLEAETEQRKGCPVYEPG